MLYSLIYYNKIYQMLNHKTRTHRSSSSIFTNLNKENNYDVGNCLIIQKDKNRNKISKLKLMEKNPKLIQQNLIQPLISKRSFAEPDKKSLIYRSVNLSTANENIKVDVKKIQNEILKQIYSQDVIECLKRTDQVVKPTQILNNHNISKDLRSKMVDWMIQVLSSYKCSEYTFFTAVRFMDTFFMKNKIKHQTTELHLTGVTSIFMACKYEQIYPLKLRVIYEKIAHKKLSKEQIIKKQGQILATLNFDLVGVNNYEVLMQVIEMIELEYSLEESHFSYFKKICLYLSKMTLYDCELVNNYNYCTLAAGSIYVAFKILEQVLPTFSSQQKIKQVLSVLNLKETEMAEVAVKVLHLAKSFEKIYPNLHNLRKFNDFEFCQSSLSSERTDKNQ